MSTPAQQGGAAAGGPGGRQTHSRQGNSNEGGSRRTGSGNRGHGRQDRPKDGNKVQRRKGGPGGRSRGKKNNGGKGHHANAEGPVPGGPPRAPEAGRRDSRSNVAPPAHSQPPNGRSDGGLDTKGSRSRKQNNRRRKGNANTLHSNGDDKVGDTKNGNRDGNQPNNSSSQQNDKAPKTNNNRKNRRRKKRENKRNGPNNDNGRNGQANSNYRQQSALERMLEQQGGDDKSSAFNGGGRRNNSRQRGILTVPPTANLSGENSAGVIGQHVNGRNLEGMNKRHNLNASTSKDADRSNANQTKGPKHNRHGEATHGAGSKPNNKESRSSNSNSKAVVDDGTATGAGANSEAVDTKESEIPKKQLSPEEKAKIAAEEKRKRELDRESKLIRRLCQAKMAGGDGDIEEIFKVLDKIWHRGDTPEMNTLNVVLMMCAKTGELVLAFSVFGFFDRMDKKLELDQVANLVTIVTQRAEPTQAMDFVVALSRLGNYESPAAGRYFQRHASMSVAEMVAEAQNCLERIHKQDPLALVDWGKCELNLVIRPGNKTSEVHLVNPDREARAPPPGAKELRSHGAKASEFGFQETDTAILCLQHPPRSISGRNGEEERYDYFKHGAEVMVIKTYPSLIVRFLGPPPRFMDFNDSQTRWRLDKLGNRNSYARQVDAIKNLTMSLEGCSKERKKFSPHAVLRKMLLTPTNENILSKHSTADVKIPELRGRQFQRKLEGDLQSLLNDSQLGALQHAVNKRVTLVQGPPGTGKTHTAVQILVQMVKNRLVPLPLLATSDSNIAVDNLLEGITAHGINAIRVGRPENIREDLLHYSMDELMRSQGRGNARSQSQRLLQRADVICATCIGSGSDMLSKYAFHTVLIDECTQATETAVLVPISRGCQQLILVGDHCQLPPTVISDVAMEKGLAVSLFSRLADQQVQPVLLDTQYRMHPLIAEFPSDSFYRGRVKTGISVRDRMPPLGFPWPQMGTPVAFLDSSGPERVEGHSYTNEKEIEKAIWALNQLLCRDDPLLPGGAEDIGVITPYSSQSRLLKRYLRRQKHRQLGLNRIEVSTVDGFQGREKEVIIFTAVRSNDMGKVGFLDKWRRMNVMMTRPRRGLIIIGNKKTLRCDRRWGKWLQWAASAGVIFNERASGRYIPSFLGDTLVGESEEVDTTVNQEEETKKRSINSAVPQAFLDAQKGISSDTWDSTNSPVSSPKTKQWDATKNGSDDDWEALDSDGEDDEDEDSKKPVDGEGSSSGKSLGESNQQQVNVGDTETVLDSMKTMKMDENN